MEGPSAEWVLGKVLRKEENTREKGKTGIVRLAKEKDGKLDTR